MALETLDPSQYDELMAELDEDSKWKIISTYFVETWNLPRRRYIDDIQRPNPKYSPAQLLWMELKSGGCTIKALSYWLQKCGLLYAQYILQGAEEELKITIQPQGEEPSMDDTISITCTATGLPPPSYQWIHRNGKKLNETSGTLSLYITSPDQEGVYVCRVSQYKRNGELVSYKDSAPAHIKIKPTRVKIKKQPASTGVKLGESFILNCAAIGYPIPQYQWYKNGAELYGEDCSILQIVNFQRKDRGEYFCRVSNSSGEEDTRKVQVWVDYPPQIASAKIALLIANDDYPALKEKLLTPENDVALLASHLKDIGFYVTCLKNLTLEEMVHAVELFQTTLLPKSYVLVYFVGLGFEVHRSFYMMPVDVSQKVSTKDAFFLDKLLSCLTETKPVLLVCILDICVKKDRIIDKVKSENCKYESIDNLCIVTSTWSHNSSYKQEATKNGSYAWHLSKNVGRSIPAQDLLEEVENSVKELKTYNLENHELLLTTTPTRTYRCFTDESSILCPSDDLRLTKLTAFEPKTFKTKFSKLNVSFEITVQPLRAPYLNMILLTTSGLENWEVNFQISPENQVKLLPKGQNCVIHNPQRIDKDTGVQKLVINIRRRNENGIEEDSECFSYKKHVPEMLKFL